MRIRDSLKSDNRERSRVVSCKFRTHHMTAKLFVGNIPFSSTEDSLRDLFSQVGEVIEVAMMNDRETGRPRGFAFVTMSSSEEAERAIQEIHGKDLDGRELSVNEARPREERPSGGGGFRGGPRGGGQRGGPRGGGGYRDGGGYREGGRGGHGDDRRGGFRR